MSVLKSFARPARCLLIAAACAAIPTMSIAQDAKFSSPDGSIELQGKVMAFDGRTYVIKSILGEINVDASSVTCEGAGCPIRQVRTSWTQGTVGENIVLTTLDGSMSVEGDLVAMREGRIRVRSSIGDFEVPAAKMTCAGAGCPEEVEEVTYVIPGA